MQRITLMRKVEQPASPEVLLEQWSHSLQEQDRSIRSVAVYRKLVILQIFFVVIVTIMSVLGIGSLIDRLKQIFL